MTNPQKTFQGVDAAAHKPAVFFAVDDFLADPAATRRDALSSDFIDWQAPGGEIYRRVCLKEVPGLRNALESILGPVEILAQGYRLNFAGETPNQAIHSDLGWGERAAVLYLTDGPGGTAFWRHRKTGATLIEAGQQELLTEVSGDFEDAGAWDQVGLVPMAFNRCAIYDGRLFHSRWPFEAFGSTPEDGRLVAVAFFNLKGAA